MFQVVDFTQSLSEDVMTFSMGNPSEMSVPSNINFWAYINVFSKMLWMAMIAICIVQASALAAIRCLTFDSENDRHSNCFLTFFLDG